MRSASAEKFPVTQRAIAVLWPSFATAIVTSGLFFSAFDPLDLYPFHSDVAFSPLAAYSVGFLIFWLLAALSSYGTLYLLISNHKLSSYRAD